MDSGGRRWPLGDVLVHTGANPSLGRTVPSSLRSVEVRTPSRAAAEHQVQIEQRRRCSAKSTGVCRTPSREIWSKVMS